MSRRLGLRLIPDGAGDEQAARDERSELPTDADQLTAEQLEQIARRARRNDRAKRDQPPALGETPTATPSR
jgi:hypothetical protein